MSPKLRVPLDVRLAEVLLEMRHKPVNEWLDQASALVGDVECLRRSYQRMHRRAQRAETQALREGQRADRMARRLRQALTLPRVRQQ